MPRPRFATLDPTRRRAILDAAAAEFAEAGVDGASYNRVIARAGVSKGAMYYYFDNKEDLLHTVLADAVARASAAIPGPGRYADAAGFWSQVHQLCARALEFIAREPVLATLAKRMMTAGDGPLAKAVAEVARPIAATSERLLRGGQKVGAVRDDLPLALLVHLVTAVGEAMDRWLFARWEQLRPADLAALPAQLVDLLARVVAPAPAPRTPKKTTTRRKR